MDERWIVVVEDGDNRTCYGPFSSERNALWYEDAHIDAPAGARALILRLWAPKVEERQR